MGGWVLYVHFSFHRHLIEYKIMCLLFLIIGVLYVNRSRPYFTSVLCVSETWFLLEPMFAHKISRQNRSGLFRREIISYFIQLP